MQVAPNLTPEERAFIERGKAIFAEAERLPLTSDAFQAKMDDQALTNAALAHDSKVHDRVMGMPYDEFEAEFADVLAANAHDQGEGTEREPVDLRRQSRGRGKDSAGQDSAD